MKSYLVLCGSVAAALLMTSGQGVVAAAVDAMVMAPGMPAASGKTREARCGELNADR